MGQQPLGKSTTQGIPDRVLPLILSDQGISTQKFGPPGWRFIHLVAMNYPLQPTRDQEVSYFRFFESLCHILPCKFCRKEFCKMTQTPGNPLYLDKKRFRQRRGEQPGAARIRLFLYTLQLHDCVNRRLRKPRKPLHRYIEMYARMRSVSTINTKNT